MVVDFYVGEIVYCFFLCVVGGGVDWYIYGLVLGVLILWCDEYCCGVIRDFLIISCYCGNGMMVCWLVYGVMCFVLVRIVKFVCGVYMYVIVLLVMVGVCEVLLLL